MAPLPLSTKAIQHQVEMGKVQQSRLCQQAPPPQRCISSAACSLLLIERNAQQIPILCQHKSSML
eukprot:12550509-Ditylum_brightwellii.AAC.1